jgi:hypothetical protein
MVYKEKYENDNYFIGKDIGFLKDNVKDIQASLRETDTYLDKYLPIAIQN